MVVVNAEIFYGAQVNLYMAVRIAFELPYTGGVRPKADISPMSYVELEIYHKPIYYCFWDSSCYFILHMRSFTYILQHFSLHWTNCRSQCVSGASRNFALFLCNWVSFGCMRFSLSCFAHIMNIIVLPFHRFISHSDIASHSHGGSVKLL